MISSTCKYAIRALIFLALYQEDDKKMGIKHIADHLEIPAPFLGKIMQQLSKNKVLSSTKGPHGGFSLAHDPHQIAIYDIVKIIDGIDVFNSCLLGLRICENDPEKKSICPMHQRSEPLRKELERFYKESFVGEIADNLSEYKDIIKI